MAGRVVRAGGGGGAVRASGVSGELRYGYQRAIGLGAWTIDLDVATRQFRFRAAILDRHPVWADRTPLDLRLALGNVRWLWRGLALSIGETEVTAVLACRPEAIADDLCQEEGRSA